MLLDDGVDVVSAHEEVVLTVDLDLVATELAVDHDVALVNVERDEMCIRDRSKR